MNSDIKSITKHHLSVTLTITQKGWIIYLIVAEKMQINYKEKLSDAPPESECYLIILSFT